MGAPEILRYRLLYEISVFCHFNQVVFYLSGGKIIYVKLQGYIFSKDLTKDYE